MKIFRLINFRGSITVFISIVLSSIFLVVGAFTDAARIRLAHSQVQRANQAALSSVLACYNNQLKDQYGLFGVFQDHESLYDCFEEYFTQNLNLGSQDILYGFNIESIGLEQPLNLENTDIFENQIMEFMKYRAPYEIATDLLSKIEGIKNISSGSKLYKRKMETDKKAGSIGEMQMQLEDKTQKINNSRISSEIQALKNKFIDQSSIQKDIKEKLSSLNKLLSSEKEITARESLISELKALTAELDSVNKEKKDIKAAIMDSLNMYKSLNSDAKAYAQKITEQKDELLNRIEEEIKFVQDSQDGLEELTKAYNESLSHMKSAIKEDNSGSIIDMLERNLSSCQNIINKEKGSEDDFISALDSLSDSDTINYVFNKSGPSHSEDEDNRDKVIQTLKKTFNQKGEMKTIESRVFRQLPSQKRSLPEENSTWDIMDFNSINGAEEQLDYLAEKENSLTQIASNIMDELFMNEYIMGIFRHDVPLLKDEEDSKAYNLRSEDKSKRDGLFSNYEVEYVINGNKDEAINYMLIKSEIMAIRLIANVIHIYTDASKMSRVTSLAAALSSWNAGLSTPLIQTMLVFSWAMFESVFDLEQLGLGEKIALFKTKNQWKTDISGAVSKQKVADTEKNPFLLSYHDYLRIFLLLTDKDKKIARVQDLVQLNVGLSSSGFVLDNTYVFLKADTAVSIKNLFVSFPSFTTSSRLNISRSYIDESMYLGY